MARLLAVSGAYMALAQLSWSVGALPGNISPVWMPAGLAVGLTVTRGRGVLVAVFAGELIVNVMAGQSWRIAAGMAAGNVLEAAAAWWVLGSDRTRVTLLRRSRHVVRWVLATVLAASVSATVGVGSLVAGGVVPVAAWWHSALTWWAGDVLGILTLGTTLLVWSARPRSLLLPRRRQLESLAAVAGLTATCLLVFEQSKGMPYLVFPFMAWLALRGSQRTASVAICVTTAIAVVGTVHGQGPFTQPSDVTSRLWLLNVFLAILAVTGLLLAAMVSERDAAHTRLQDANNQLEQRVAERTAALTREQARLDEAQQAAAIGSWEWDISADTISWSRQLYRLFNLDPDDFDASYASFLSLIHPDDRPTLEELVQRCLNSHQSYQLDHRLNPAGQPEGPVRWIRSRGQLTLDDHGRPHRMSGTAQEVTETIALHAELAKQAHHDSLTGLPNRHHLATRTPAPRSGQHDAADEQANDLSSGAAAQSGLLFLDLDGFKPINDSHGHAAGDHVLTEVAKRLRTTVRPDATVARMGGDEFAVILPGLSDPHDLQRIARRLVTVLAEPITIDGAQLSVTASIGGSLQQQDETLEQALHRADQAMYAAKAQGGHQHLLAADSGPAARPNGPAQNNKTSGLDVAQILAR